MDFLEEQFPIAGDGAMGTELMNAGIQLESCFEELCVSRPELVAAIHEHYIEAGARVIRTNSFGANAIRLAQFGWEKRVNELNWSAAQLARQSTRGKGVYVAGSVGPTGVRSEEVFRQQIGALLEGGVQLIFLETFTDPEELALALYVKQSLHHCPVVCSLACAPDGRFSTGVTLGEALKKLRDLGADLVGVNCVNGLQAMLALCRATPGIESAFPNAGLPEKQADGRYIYSTSPDAFARGAMELAQAGVRLIGGCCGIGPLHIEAMTGALKKLPC